MHKRTREALRVAKAFVRYKYRGVGAALGLKRDEFRDWVESVAGEGVALAFYHQADWDPERGAFTTWICFKTRQVAIKALRGQDRYKKALELLEEQPPASSHDGLESYLKEQELHELLAELKKEHQEAILLSYRGHKTEEIAAIMGRNANAVYGLLRRAQTKSRQLRQKSHQAKARAKPRPRGRPRTPREEPDEPKDTPFPG